jgi:urate oxidase/2-oxo-4-hydroxy-4-carboxy-5-ureidoimidazoline decarboxylase
VEPGDLFEPSSPLARLLVATGPHRDLIAAARALAPRLSGEDKVATLNAHPRIGERTERMSASSRAEQRGLGTGAGSELEGLNEEYEKRFGFRFVVFVNRRPRAEIATEMRERMERDRDRELDEGLRAVVDIAEDRLRAAGGSQTRHEIHYGKAEISFYRSHARPLRVASIPESGFSGRDNLLLGGLISIDVHGDQFWAAYAEGDNSQVVATDTMKNLTYELALEYEGATAEGLCALLAERFLETYPQMGRVGVNFRERAYERYSDRLLGFQGGDHHSIRLLADRTGVVDLESGRRDLRLVKLTGSAFARFARDEHTTLVERADRPLHLYLDVFWRYAEAAAACSGDGQGYVASEQVADHVRHTFDSFVSMSIQHLVHEMGQRLLVRFPQLAAVRLEAQNRLWDTSAEAPVGPAKVFSDPKPAHGSIGLTLTRD